ncbi:peptide ABC transporter ATP-binding protein [Clostridia bacterium]|nr:peptide ABC transporter ATP-binding protein [Clostridia bacterium]
MIQALNIVKRVGPTNSAIEILHGVSLTVADGEAVAIMGPSGCGKSTLLGILAGLDEPTAGKVSLDRQDIYQLSGVRLDRFRNAHFGVIFQSQNLVKELNCLENVSVPLAFSKGRIANDDRSRVRELMDWVGLDGKGKLYPYQMSGGEQQRAAIIRAMVRRPRVLFADEPTGALDQENSRNILRLFRQSIERERHSIILVTHDMAVADQCDRIIRMNDGRIA